jgi:eukaryotic-like serine/threonine-protein kinase
MLDQQATPKSEIIEEQLQRILGSKLFAASHRSQDFLRYVVERTLAGSTPKEYAIAVDVFGRGADYDPAVDATVRVEAGRLRSRLREYFETEGKFDPVCIAIPKGSYAAVFNVRELKAEAQRPFQTPTEFTTERELPPSVEPQQPMSRFRRGITAAVAIVILLVAFGTTVWLRQQRKPAVQEAWHITASGSGPGLSPDGKLLAYSSMVAGGESHIMVQQITGSEAVPITSGPYSDDLPDFSPDGTHIAFYSERNGGGIYIVPTIPGEARLVTVTPKKPENLRFSPSGSSILYSYEQKAFTVSAGGGNPVALPLNQDFYVNGTPIWAPDGTEILFYGVRIRQPDGPAAWWVVPLAGGQPRPVHLTGVEQNYRLDAAVRAWVRSADNHEWIIYSTSTLENWKFWRAAVSSGGAIDQTPELLASGIGNLGPGGSVSADGKLAYNLWSSSVSIHQISIGDHGQKLGPPLQLPLLDAGAYTSPSVSRDGRWMAYNSFHNGKPDAILLRDLSTGTDHLLDDKDRAGNGFASISPDGTRVIFERDCKEGISPQRPDGPLPCSFMVAAADGEPERVCDRCTARGFSSDGSVVLLQKYDKADANKDRIVALDLRTKTESKFLSLPDRPVTHPFFSWDDRWVLFRSVQPKDGSSSPEDASRSQILIAPVRNGSPASRPEWIPVTDGQHMDDKPQFSADGNTVYFTSTRDRFLCIWAQRLDPKTKHPVGPPFAYEHFHNAAGRASAWFVGQSDLSVARDKMLIDLMQIHSDIWMTQMP